MSLLCCFYWIQRHTWGLTRTGAHEKKTWGYPNISSPLTTQDLQPWSHPADDASISKNSATSPHSAPASGEDRACPHFSDLQGWRMYRDMYNVRGHDMSDQYCGWHGLVHLMADREVEAHSMIRSGQVGFSQSCTAMHDAHAHHAYGTYWLGTRAPIPPGRYVCQYNTMKPYLHLKVKSVTAPPLCCSETACCSRRWRSGNCFLVGWLWHFVVAINLDFFPGACRSRNPSFCAQSPEANLEHDDQEYGHQEFFDEVKEETVSWSNCLAWGCTCLSKPLFELASRESRWGAMSGPCLAEKFLWSTLLEPLHHDMCSGFLVPPARSS